MSAEGLVEGYWRKQREDSFLFHAGLLPLLPLGVKRMNVGMVGLGKLGKPVAVAIAAKGHSVMGYDVVPELMSKEFTAIEAGPNKEPHGFQTMLAKSDIKFGTLQEVVDHSEIIFLAIQTPHGKEYEGITRVPDQPANFDYSYLVDCIKKLNECTFNKPTVVAIISTVLPLTIREHVLPLVTNPNIKIVYNPFFIAMGTVVWDFYNPEFVLIGRHDAWAGEKLKELYKTIHNKPFAEMSIESAELTKVSYNTYITMKINYVNYLMHICDQIPNANVDDVTNALKMATERLVSTKYMTAGMGDGGGCHPRDNIAMSWLARRLNMNYDLCNSLMFIREKQTETLAFGLINMKQMPAHKDKPVVILGKAFKSDIGLVTGSPAVLLSNILKEYGLEHITYDPLVDGYTMHFIKPHIFFIATQHEVWKKMRFPTGSVIIDPFRHYKKFVTSDCEYIGVGIGPAETQSE